MPIKRVLIAHQSTIPHYRVPFYEAMERLRPKWWEFSVVYDREEARRIFFLTPDVQGFTFKVEQRRTYGVQVGQKQLSFQTFPFTACRYDLIVAGSELNNLSYPLSFFWRLFGKAVAYWGHGRDVSIENAGRLKAFAEHAKIWLTQRADGFFAYTNGVRNYMVNNGVDQRKVFVLNNTIDIIGQRSLFNKLMPQREHLRVEARLENKRVLLFVGRLNRQKQLQVLVDAFEVLKKIDNSYHLVIIGSGDTSVLRDIEQKSGADSFTYRTATQDIGPFCVTSDLYVFPGAVGLGPLHALCFDLTPAVIDSPVHNPEYEYLTRENALILPNGASAEQYALAIDDLLKNPGRWTDLRAQAWPSIRHLTIESMAENFIRGVNVILGGPDS
jgi:glycosyltransferase involved in cell wall biosynthesis